MRSNGTRSLRQPRFSPHIEQLEVRQVMSADPLADLLGGGLGHHVIEDQPPALEHAVVSSGELPPLDQHVLGDPDFWINPEDAAHFADYFQRVEQTLTEAHNQTGWFNVQSDYGFRGVGQTVAVIDSGVAYNHLALGGGLGANYRVVGGWDFTEENDGNPYDDGPSGGHGTHVSGIIGSSSQTNTGVAPGVDLVGLRVFNDAGNGYFSWVENALRWVIQNRTSFENPITAINLSLGVSEWNAATVPTWANLEDEFAQLEAAGVFIAVSAGNSFASFNQVGLSYPAASPYVVPVMAATDSGTIASFSQRLGRAIAAPGTGIVSTVPDYRGNNNGVADDYIPMGGTSMAAPYVAGASVLVREAMQFVGMTNITQDMIFDHMMATADSVFDAATNATYKRLDLQAAIDALMPTDDYGSTLATAYNLGTITDTATISGMIGKLTDHDYFRFTAGSTGSVVFEATAALENIVPSWQVYGSSGQTLTTANGDSVAFDVVAGQTYTVRLSSTGGMGHYTFDVTAESNFSYQDWGTVTYNQVNDVAVAGEQWYLVRPTQAGYLTVQGLFNAASGNVSVALYNSALQLVANGSTTAGQARVDFAATAGANYFVRVTGANSDVDFKLMNLVSTSGATVTAAGTAGNDTFAFTAGASHVLTINGVAYSFSAASASQFNIDGAAGGDSIILTGKAGDDTATVRVGSAVLVGAGYDVTASAIENVTAYGGGGSGDRAILYDAAGDDEFEAWTGHAQMTGVNYASHVYNFSQAYGYASSGNDRAVIHDTAGDDTYETKADRVTMRGNGYLAYAFGFDQYDGYASIGLDKAILYDSAGDDLFEAWSDRTVMSGGGALSSAHGFDEVYGYASSGNDRAIIHDTAGNDAYETKADRVTMRGDGYLAYAFGFDQFEGIATTGLDKVVMYDSAGNDRFEARPDFASMDGAGYQSTALGFDQAYGYAAVGNDLAVIHDSAGNDRYTAYFDRVTMRGGPYIAYAFGFDQFASYASTGLDQAVLNDSVGDDVYESRPERALMSGPGYLSYAYGFEQTYGYASAGNDYALIYDSPGNDEYRAWSHRVIMTTPATLAYAYNFDQTFAYASSGVDRVILYDSVGDDIFTVWANYAVMQGAGYRSAAEGFDQYFGYSSTGYDRAILYDTLADDVLTVRTWGASMLANLRQAQAQYFDELAAHSVNGGVDAASAVAVDYLFEQFGAWN